MGEEDVIVSSKKEKKRKNKKIEEEVQEIELSSSSSEEFEVAEVLVSKKVEDGKKDETEDTKATKKQKSKVSNKRGVDDESDVSDDDEDSEEEVIEIKKKKKEKQKNKKKKETEAETGDLLGFLNDFTSNSTPKSTVNESNDNETKSNAQTTNKEKSKKTKSKKKESKKTKPQKIEKESDEDLGSDDFASDSSEEAIVSKSNQQQNEDEEEEKRANQKQKKKERGDQLSDLFSSVMGNDAMATNQNNNTMDDILFGASAETLMKEKDVNHGFHGELLNHTHTQGLQIEYEFVRQQSRYGHKFNQIKLIFTNKWDKAMKGISLSPHNLDKSQQDYHDIFDGGIAELNAGQTKTDFIYVRFGKTSEMRFDINVESGTNKKRHTAKIKGGFSGELMRPNISYSVDAFIKKKAGLQAMSERNLSCAVDKIDEAANRILKAFNVGIVNSGAIKNKFDPNKQRYFAAYLLADDSDVLIALETQSNDKIVCTLHCTEFMLIDAITSVARQCLNKK